MDRIKVGLASYGMSGKVFHAPLLEAHTEFELSAVLERSKDEARKTYPEIRTLRAYADLLRQDVDLIIVNIPDHLHHDFVLKALESGKHVVVEKPFTLSVEEGRELIELAEKKELMLSVFQNRRWDSDFLTVEKVIREGQLGRLVEYETHFDRFRNFIQDSWKENPDLGTGTLYNLGSHLIDQALVLFGMPEAVYGDIRKNRTGSKVDDYFDIWLYYEGFKVILKASYLVREHGPRYQLHGTHGSFQKWGMDPQEEMLKQGKPPFPDWGLEEDEDNRGILNYVQDDKEHRQRIKSLPGNYLAYYDNIAAVIRKNASPAVTAEEGLKVIRIIEAVKESDQKGEKIAI